MAVDSSLFGAKIPAGNYAVGDKLQLSIVSGPANVRSGRGTAILKRIIGGIIGEASGTVSYWKIKVKNSDWIDEAQCMTAPLSQGTFLDQHSGAVRLGNNTTLTPNSAWVVEAECMFGVTTTIANSLFLIIDIDYPQVSSIIDPDELMGTPASIDYSVTTDLMGCGGLVGAAWQVDNVDYFKAGFQYALEEISIFGNTSGGYARGFISLSNAAGMGGLSRIIPVNADNSAIRQTIQYATPLVKGPMDVKTMLFSNDNTAVTGTSISMIHDYVKRKV